jgi:hypothetical protein
VDDGVVLGSMAVTGSLPVWSADSSDMSPVVHDRPPSKLV